jgi:hypothetical protein
LELSTKKEDIESI